MGCCCGSGQRKAPPPQDIKNTINLLNLGVGGCGKTTFVKQMKIMHDVSWDEVEIANYKKIIKTNFINGTQDLISIAEKTGKVLSPENLEVAKSLTTLKARNEEKITSELGNQLLQIWNDPVIQQIASHKENLVYIHLPYFFDNIERILAEDYTPSTEDILRCRQRTAGANSTPIWVDKNWFTFWDIGGQRPERSKWESVLNENNFAAILYFVASDEFDCADKDEEYEYTKFEMSKMIFREMLTSNLIAKDAPVILFMNRSDLFEDRWKTTEGPESFRATFPDFQGESSQDALNFLIQYFLEILREDYPKNNPIISHTTCALDTRTMLVVWRSVRQYVMKEALKELGLLGGL
jgi:GTPase SAR1 family protein